jgi:hypothetical protein
LSWLRVGLASLAASMVMTVPAAAAQTFCVRGTGNAPGCGAATQEPTIQAAVDAAAGSAGADVVRLEGRLPAQGFTIGAGNVVDVDGTDADALTITSSDHIEVHEPGASISHAAFVVQTPAPAVAIDLANGTLDDVHIAGAFSVEATIRLGDATLDGVRFEGVGYPGTAVNAVGPGGVIERSVLFGEYTLKSTSDGLVVRNSVLQARTGAFGAAALRVSSGSATVDDTLIVLDQSEPGYGDGVSVAPAAGETPDLALRSVTVTGLGSDPDVTPPHSNGVFSSCSSGATANVSLLDTAVILFTTDLLDFGCGMSLDHVRYGGRVGTTFVDGPSVVGGGYATGWIAAPIYESSLIDAGSDRSDDVHDFQGLPRVVDGDGDGVARRDIGAWEYQREPPVAVLGDEHVPAGKTAVIDGSASDDPDDGDFGFLSYAWKVDGAPVQNLSDRLQTVFATPGPHAVELTVSDPAGLSDTATATITADGGDAPPTPAPDLGSGPPRTPHTAIAVRVPQPTTPLPITTAKVPPTSAVLLDHRLSKAGKLRVKVTCGGGSAVCRGRVQLRAGSGKTAVAVGRSAEFVIIANRPKTVSVTVSAAGQKLLRSHKAKGVAVSVRLYKLPGTSYTNGVGGRVKP